MNTHTAYGIASLCLLTLPAFFAGCAPAGAPSPYTLVAQLTPISSDGNIVAAVIDVHGGGCNVRVVTLESTRDWFPSCRVNKDQPAYKSFAIDGHSVNLGEVNGRFELLGGAPPVIPVVSNLRHAKDSATRAGDLMFPDTWTLEPYPGQLTLTGQDAGFMVTKAVLTINGSAGLLDVTYKTTYAPLHLSCTVTTDEDGDFTLAFDPASLLQIAGRGTYTINLVSEGSSITGSIWDANDFSTWQPAMPPRWVRAGD
ncbi:MAG: hypothetical protein ACRETQ_03060 [Gammaproteobacteria bacterium]